MWGRVPLAIHLNEKPEGVIWFNDGVMALSSGCNPDRSWTNLDKVWTHFGQSVGQATKDDAWNQIEPFGQWCNDATIRARVTLEESKTCNP